MSTELHPLLLAMQHHRAGNLGMAVELYRAAAAAEMDNPEARYLLAVACYENRMRREAVEHFRAAIAIRPEGLYYSGLGVALLSLEMLDESLEALQTAQVLDSRDADILVNLAAVRQRRGENAEAIRVLRRALEMRPHSAEIHYQLGEVARLSEDLNSAERHLLEAVRLFPQHAAAHFSLATVQHELERFQDAMSHFRAAASDETRAPEALYRLSLLQAECNDLESALQSLEELLARHPESEWLWNDATLLRRNHQDASQMVSQDGEVESADVTHHSILARLQDLRQQFSGSEVDGCPSPSTEPCSLDSVNPPTADPAVDSSTEDECSPIAKGPNISCRPEETIARQDSPDGIGEREEDDGRVLRFNPAHHQVSGPTQAPSNTEDARRTPMLSGVTTIAVLFPSEDSVLDTKHSLPAMNTIRPQAVYLSRSLPLRIHQPDE